MIRNHPFIEGNKRVAFTVAAIFLEINGYIFDPPEAETVVTFGQLAAGILGEDHLATWFQDSLILNKYCHIQWPLEDIR